MEVDHRVENIKRGWPDPTPQLLDDPAFNAVWHCIKTWDINVPEQYNGYCGATGNHVVAILNALSPFMKPKTDPVRKMASRITDMIGTGSDGF